MTHQPHDVIANRYRLDDPIATGGMGEVWRATDTVLGRPVAAKILRADRALDPQFQTRFRNEARALAALHHPGIVDVYDYGQESGTDAYLVMAYVNGQPLDQRITRQGRLSPAETMSIVAHLGRALQAAHDAGIVHRDVKPANMIIQPDGTVVLVDFGVARSVESAALTAADEVVGTVSYIAPEQVSQQPVGPAADLYALGVVAYHCLAGHPPFLGDNPVTVAMQHLHDAPPPLPSDIPAQVSVLVTTAMAKDPAARFPSAAAMAAAAEKATCSHPADGSTVPLALSPVRPGHAPGPARPAAGRSYRRWVLAVLAALLTLLGAGATMAVIDPFGWFPGSPRPATSTSTPASPAEKPSIGRTTRPGGGDVITPTPSGATSSSPHAATSSTGTPPPSTAQESSRPPASPSAASPTDRAESRRP